MSFIRTLNRSATSTVTINRPSVTITIEDVNSAVVDGDIDRVIDLLSKNEEISINQALPRDPYRNTLLHVAISMRHLRLIRYLIDHGADLKVKNKFGESCADLLSKSGLGQAIEHLAQGSALQVAELKRQIGAQDNTIADLQLKNDTLRQDKSKLETEVSTLKRKNADLEKIADNLIETTSKKRRT